MRKDLKDYLIPHQGNDHRPHLLRKNSLSFILICLIVLEFAFVASTFSLFKNSSFLAAVLPSVLVSLTNKSRIEYSVSELQVSPVLVRAAELKAQDMASKGYFAHTSPDGRTPWHWLDRVGYLYLYAGENLAVNFTESKDISDAWMRSPAHRKNIINNRYSEIGIATARGVYKGQEATFVVQFFGRPALVLSQSEKGELNKNPQLVPDVSKEPAPVIVKNNASVKGDSTQVSFEKRPLFKVLESPRAAMAVVILASILLLAVALALAVLIKIKIQHPKMIAGTLLVIFIALGLLFINSRIFISMVELPVDTEYASTFEAF